MLRKLFFLETFMVTTLCELSASCGREIKQSQARPLTPWYHSEGKYMWGGTKHMAVIALSVCRAGCIMSSEKIVVLPTFRIFLFNNYLLQWLSDYWVLWGFLLFSFLSCISALLLQVSWSVSRGRDSTGCKGPVELKGGTGECPCQPGNHSWARASLYTPDWKQTWSHGIV